MRWTLARANNPKLSHWRNPVPENEKITDEEIDAFDAKARDGFEHMLRITQALREARAKEVEPKPGSDEAQAAIKDAIKQGAE
jgi:hypothetical protein